MKMGGTRQSRRERSFLNEKVKIMTPKLNIQSEEGGASRLVIQ